MKMMLILKEFNKEIDALIAQMTPYNVGVYFIDSGGRCKNGLNIEEDQKNFDFIYCPDSELLINLKVKIPYFYDLKTNCFNNELSYDVFKSYYSMLCGANAVFVNDKQLNKMAHWLGLNTYWVNPSIAVHNIKRNFNEDILKIAYIHNGNPNNLELLKNILMLKRKNWKFIIYATLDLGKEILASLNLPNTDTSVQCWSGDWELVRETFYADPHIFLNLPRGRLRGDDFPNAEVLEAASWGCCLLSSNPEGNNTNVVFDRVHYFRLDDNVDEFRVLDMLKYIDARREKLGRMVRDTNSLLTKYFDPIENAKKKIEIFRKYI